MREQRAWGVVTLVGLMVVTACGSSDLELEDAPSTTERPEQSTTDECTEFRHLDFPVVCEEDLRDYPLDKDGNGIIEGCVSEHIGWYRKHRAAPGENLAGFHRLYSEVCLNDGYRP